MTRVMPSVYARRELQAVVVSVKALPRDVRRAVSQGTRETMNPVWRGVVANHARTPQQRAVLAKGARIAAGNPPRAVAGSSMRPLSGGLRPGEDTRAFEMGARNPNRRGTWVRRSPSGASHQVRGYPDRPLPRHHRGGHVIYPAFKELAPRLTSLWVQTVIRKTYDALERR